MKMMIKLLFVIVCCAFVVGCSVRVKDVIPTTEPPITGGTTDRTDYSAPKVIESKDIEHLSAYFDVGEAADYSPGGAFFIKIDKEEDGQFALVVDGAYSYEMKMSKEDVDGIQEIIDRLELVKRNGKDRVTAGLAPGYQEVFLRVNYASGEQLYFAENGSPREPWIVEMRKYLGDLMIEDGFTDLMPPEEATTIDRFSIEFNVDNLAYRYGELQETDGTTVFHRQTYDLDAEETVSEAEAELTDEFYEGLQEVIESCGLRYIDTSGRITFGNNWSKEGFMNIYLDYELGQVYAEYGPDELPENWDQMREALQTYLDEYIETHQIEMEE